MYLESIALTGFRNYVSLNLPLGPGTFILWGDNAQGKSNILEAVYMLATTKSSRASNERELINWETLDDPLPSARVTGQLSSGGEPTKLEIGLVAERGEAGVDGESSFNLRKQTRVNGVPRRASDVVGTLNAVLFDPQDVDLVTGPPSVRRRYLDVTISQMDRQYLKALQRYARILTQRNHLLRSIREGRSQISHLRVWDQPLTEEAAFIHLSRSRIIDEMAALGSVIYDELTGGGETFSLNYLPNPKELSENRLEDAEEVRAVMQTRLSANVDREIGQGATMVGPHRDDVQFAIEGRDTGLYGSRGQQRTVVATLKLAEVSILVDKTGEDPILLLDDILSELDETRRRRVLQTALASQQTILTTTDLDRIDESVKSQARLLRVQEGTLIQDQ